MKIKDSIKGFTQGVSKVIPPEQTYEFVSRAMARMSPPLVEGYYEVQQPSKIPQTRFVGTTRYRKVLKIFMPGKDTGTNGKGHSKEQSLASGLMELIERYSCSTYFLSDDNVYRICSFNDIKKNAFTTDDVYANLIDSRQANVLQEESFETAKLRWYEGYCLDGKKAYLPLGLLVAMLEGTNGMASGNSLEEALLHGICEVIERHCLSLISYNKLTTPRIDPSTITSPIARRLIRQFRYSKYPVLIGDFSLGIGVPVIGVVRQIDNGNCIITAGVATNRDEALIRALTENSQAEDPVNYKALTAVKHCFEYDTLKSFQAIANIDHNNMRVELRKIEEILLKQAMKIFFVNTTDKSLNIPCVIVYIRGAKTIFDHKDITSRNILKLLMGVCLDTENYKDLNRYMKRAMKHKYIERGEFFYLRGLALRRRKRYKAAIPCLSKAWRLRSNGISKSDAALLRMNSSVNLGLCYQAIHDMDTAIDCYWNAVELSTKFTFDDIERSLVMDRPLFHKARDLFQDINRFKKVYPGISRKQLKSLLYRYYENKRSILLHINNAHVCYNAKQYDQAIAELNAVLDMDSAAARMHNVHLLLGYCYEEGNLFGKAIRELNIAQMLDPLDARINHSLAKCYEKLGKLKSANRESDKLFQKIKSNYVPLQVESSARPE